MQEFLPLANRLADEARKIVEMHFRTGFEVISKDDASPVTIADRAIEKRIREILEDQRPEDGIFGEEFGVKDSKNGLTWVLDPIDGTKSFVIGRPTFGTLIALCENDAPVLGIIDQAILDERWIGAKDMPTTFNALTVKTKPSASLSQARICSTSPSMFKGIESVCAALDQDCKLIWGSDCYGYGLLANGYADIVVEARLSPYDFAALVPVVQGAGGVIADWDGKPLTMQSEGRVLAAANQALWNEAAEKIRQALV